MRKLMLFTIGFAIAAVIGVYWLTAGDLLLFASLCFGLLGGSLLLCLRFSKAKLLALILLGATVSSLWQFGYDRVYLSQPVQVDQSYGNYTMTAVDYAEPTEYGSAVNCILHFNGRIYKVKVYLPEGVSAEPGDRLEGYFRLRSTLPGDALDSSYYRSHGTFLVANLVDVDCVMPAQKLPWYGYPAAIRRYLQDTIDTTFSHDTAAFAKALLLGDAQDLDYATDTAFKVSGMRHIIAVSGLHISILFSLLFLLTGNRRRLTCIISLFVLLLFAAVAGFTPSITRACIMHGLMSIAFLLRREYDPPTALSFAVLVMLILDPWTVSHVGFQLSVGCVAGILLFSERIRNWMLDYKRLGKYKGWKGRLCQWFALSVSVSLSATVITTPLCALYFGMVSLVSVLSNFLTLWLVTYIFYGIVLVCVASTISLPVAGVLAWPVAIAIRIVVGIAKGLASFPFAAVYVKNVYMLLWLGFCYALLAVYLMAKRKRPLIFGCSCLLMLCIALLVSWTEPLRDECRVTVLDVGQGQCILLQSDGKNYLVDCGGDSDTNVADEAANLLLSQGIFRLDGLILTHFDRDHAGGAAYLLSRVPADVILMPQCPDPDGTRQQLLAQADCPVLTLTEDTVLSFGETTLTLIPSIFATGDNESGLCVLFQTKNYDILITGDRSISGEKELLQHMALPELELLVVGHHGSRHSTGKDLLAVTKPAVAVISVSANNYYGHPTQEVLDRLDTYGCLVYRTDRDGTVIFRG